MLVTSDNHLKVIPFLSSCKNLIDGLLRAGKSCQYILDLTPEEIISSTEIEASMWIMADRTKTVLKMLNVSFYPSFYTIPQNLKKTHAGVANNFVREVFVADNTIYAATSGGLSISTDGGESWIYKTTVNNLGNNATKAVFVADNIIYVGTDHGLSISKDNGLSWQTKTSANDFTNAPVEDVYILDSIIYTATNGGGLLISKDGGESWYAQRSLINGFSGSDNVYGVFASGSNVYAATYGGLSISVDGGENWTNKTTFNGMGSNFVNGVFASGDTIYAATFNGLSVSLDHGNNWTTYLENYTVHNVTEANGVLYISTNKGLLTHTTGH
ncbi:WD40/YVTN/BNR-like repeat-containing protein [Facilibium subflavum]|uniref:WD40/YVTN/BNR-like repeat-containing protein n=1 Tax=Facilibium subflavum TaxID=2219058 RepID=UPI000E647722|nr:PQQ-binding-like beta-propeller repeat protein [Facilibium subflavum]